MLFKSSIAVLASSTLVLAANHDIQVGPSLAYTPQITTAAVGDTLTFKFSSNAHDVASGPFDQPCQASANSFYSGLDVRGKTFVVRVNSTDPIYFYCTVQGHCQGGMVGGVNIPTTGNPMASYAQRAVSVGSSGEPAAVQGGVLAAAASGSSASATGSSTSSAAASASGSTSSHPATTTAASATTSRASTTSAAPSATRSGSAATSNLVEGGGKTILHGLAVTLASLMFWAGLV